MDPEHQYSITDSRDGKTYCVSRLADGNIWMTQNLDFDIVQGETYTSDDTDITTNWSPSESTHVTSDASWDNSGSYESYITPESYDPGDLCWNVNIDAANTGTLNSNTTTCTDRHYHIGNYYNWTAAVAMNDSSSYMMPNAYSDANQSVCPAGWTLPKSGPNFNSGSFAYLFNQAGLTPGHIHQVPHYFVYGGTWIGESSNVGHTGNYWSSATFNDGVLAYNLYFDYGTMDQSARFHKWYGYSIRCIAR